MWDFLRENTRKQNGQALLVVVLVMVVSLTVGLSIASKSITNYKTSTEQAESQKALSAAEAGIEQAIKSTTANTISNTISINSSSYKTTIAYSSATGGQSLLLNGGNLITRDQGIDVWLSNYPDYSLPADPSQQIHTLNIYWGQSSTPCENPALEIAVISGPKAAPVLTKYAFDPCLGRSDANHFTSVSKGTGGSSGFSYGEKITPITLGLLARIIPIYANGVIAVSGDQALPSQGKVITSIGSSGTSQRAVTVFQGHPEISSEFFPYNLFSP